MSIDDAPDASLPQDCHEGLQEFGENSRCTVESEWQTLELEYLPSPGDMEELPVRLVNWDREVGILQVHCDHPIVLLHCILEHVGSLHLEVHPLNELVEGLQVHDQSPEPVLPWDSENRAQELA